MTLHSKDFKSSSWQGIRSHQQLLNENTHTQKWKEKFAFQMFNGRYGYP